MKKINLYPILIVLLCILNASAQEKTFTCINEKGEKLFSVKAYSTGRFHEGMAEVQKLVATGDKSAYRSGFIDATGEMVIPAKYERVYHFSHGVAWVKDPGTDGYYLINKKGERLTTESWKKVSYFMEGHAAVYDAEDKMGFVNRYGKQVVPCQYLGSSGFEEGLCCVQPYNQKEEKYGFIDTTGKLVIPYQFKQAGTTSFNRGEARAQVGGVTCLINKKGEVIFKPTLVMNGQGFYDNLCAGYTNYNTRSGWGFYNRKNQWVIKPQYDNAESFNHGLSVVEKAGKYGVIDTTGKIIIPIKYATVFGHPSDAGFFGLQEVLNGPTTYVRADGKPFTTEPMKYLISRNGAPVLPYVDPDGKYGYMNLDGTVFIRAQFDFAEVFSDGKAWIKGDATSLKTAPGVSKDAFVVEYKVGDRVKANWKGQGKWYGGKIREIGKSYYLILYDDNAQEWVTYDNLKKE